MNYKEHHLDYFGRIKAAMELVDHDKISALVNEIYSMFGTQRTIFVIGNGGSASTGSHMACDLSKTILGRNPRESESRLRVICLNDNIPLLTAWSNDEGYEHAFSEQLRNLGAKDDLLIIITGSGNSQNIIQTVDVAGKIGMKTFGILGFDGGRVKDLLEDYIHINSDDYGVVEDMHMIMVHMITDWLKKTLNG